MSDTTDLRIDGAPIGDELDAAITDIRVDLGESVIGQLSITSDEPLGDSIEWPADDWWDLGATSGSWRPDDETRFEYRSRLSRALRKRFSASVEKGASPSAWVTRRAALAGGRAVCQPSSGRGAVVQRSGSDRQSDLDVIESLCKQLGWSWVEWGGVLLFGSRYWAWTGPSSSQQLWDVTWGGDSDTDAAQADLTLDEDDTRDVGAGSLALPYDLGCQVRPWDRLDLSGFGSEWDGIWLVTGVNFVADGSTDVDVEVAIPRPPGKQSGSSS